MSKERNLAIVSSNKNELTMWEDNEKLPTIKALFAPKLNNLEFEVFVGMGKATNLNPFLREIWCVKYDERSPAQIFIGRDGYRKSAQAHPLYDYHYVESIHSNDKFKIKNGEIDHEYSFTDRGNLVAAYCVVKRKNASRSVHTIVDLKEYNTNKSVWAGKPSTMLKKVAEAQALRAAFQDIFGGTYHEHENYIDEKKEPISTKITQLIQNKSIDNVNDEQEELEVEYTIGSDDVIESESEIISISSEQYDEISCLIHEKEFSRDRMDKALHHFAVDSIESMTATQAHEFICILNRL